MSFINNSLRLDVKEEKRITEGKEVATRKGLVTSAVLFLGTITSLVLHSFVEEVLLIFSGYPYFKGSI